MNRMLPLLITLALATPVMAAEARSSLQACDQAFEAGDYAAAATHAQQALQATPENRDAYLCLGRAQGELARHVEAVAALKAAVKLSKAPVEQIVALTLLGNEYQAAKAYDEVIVSYRQSLEIARAEKSARFELVNLNLIGEAMEKAGDGQGALAQYEQGLQLAANDNERADSQARIAGAYVRLGRYDKAIEHQVKSVLYQEKSGDFNHYANALIELSRICIEGRQYADAEKWLHRFLGTIVNAGDSYWQARARLMLARAKSGIGAVAEASDQLSQAKAMAQKIGAGQLLKEITETESSIKTM